MVYSSGSRVSGLRAETDIELKKLISLDSSDREAFCKKQATFFKAFEVMFVNEWI